jgi:hypothetical protein
MHAGQRRYDDAIRCYLGALHKDPYYVPAWHNLGVLYQHLGDEQAAKCFATEKEIESRQKQINAVEADTKRRTEAVQKVLQKRTPPPCVEIVPVKSHPVIGRLCSLGIGIGLVIVVLELKYSGFFSRVSSVSFTGITAVVLSLGVLISLVSFFVYNRLRYARWCVISPGYFYLLKDPDEPQSHKLLVIGILGIGVLMIPVALYLLLYRVGVNPSGTSDTGLAVIILVVVVFMLTGADMLLSWMLTRMKESKGTFTPSYEQLHMRQLARKKLTFFGGFFGTGLLLVSLKSLGVIQDQNVYGTLIVIWLIACAFIFFIYPRFISGRRR